MKTIEELIAYHNEMHQLFVRLSRKAQPAFVEKQRVTAQAHLDAFNFLTLSAHPPKLRIYYVYAHDLEKAVGLLIQRGLQSVDVVSVGEVLCSIKITDPEASYLLKHLRIDPSSRALLKVHNDET